MKKIELVQQISYKTIAKGGMAEITEKKSRFLANCRHVESEEEAVAFIGEMKKKYWDARHSCAAFVIGDRGELTRCSDDGEPTGTAGKPILDVILGEKLTNLVVVVTRYFGGTLLGTGGLVRAYSEAARCGLAVCEKSIYRFGVRSSVVTDYTNAGKVRYLLEQNLNIQVRIAYAEMVEFELLIPIEENETIKQKIIEATLGKAEVTEITRLYFRSDE